MNRKGMLAVTERKAYYRLWPRYMIDVYSLILFHSRPTLDLFIENAKQFSTGLHAENNYACIISFNVT